MSLLEGFYKTNDKPRPSRVGMDSPLTESLNTSLPKFLLMAVTDGASVTETPRLKRGSMWYASAPSNGPILGIMDSHHAGWEPPLVPVELRPLPVAKGYGQGGAMKQEAPPFMAG